MIRKNQHKDPAHKCPGETGGVDLNRNYAYEFGVDNQGSDADPCDESYRGKAAFSEPETRAIRALMEKMKGEIVSAMNFHNYGDLWIQPYNYIQDPSDAKLNQDPKRHWLYEAYADLEKRAYHPKGAK